MVRKRRFIVSFRDYSKEVFLALASKAVKGVEGNPDFADAPVTFTAFKAANDAMVAAAPDAVKNNIVGLRIFRPLRSTMEKMMEKMGTYAQGVIGENPERMEASGLPLTKDPAARPEDINEEVIRPKVEPGDTTGKIKVSVRPLPAADGIIIEVRQADLTYIERAKVVGFKATLGDFTEDEVVVIQIRYWNNGGFGPRMGRPLAIVA